MHFNCLIAVKNIPHISADSPFGIAQSAIDRMVENHLNMLFEQKKRDTDFMIGIHIGELNTVRNAFSRSVCEQIGGIMDSTSTDPMNPKYVEFVAVGDALKERYETERYDCVKTPDGKILPIEQRRFEIIDGLVYEKNAGHLHYYKRTKKAKKMKAYPDYPLKCCFRCYEDFLENIGYEYDEEHQAYGWYGNPKAFWDWYEIGGRWPTTFLVPDSCFEYGVGARAVRDEDMPPAPKGYKWAVMARKKDIAWDVMYRLGLKQGMERFRKLKACFEDNASSNPRVNKTKNGIADFFGMAYIKGESMYENLKRHRISSKTKYHMNLFAFLGEDWWVYDKDENNPDSEYPQLLDQFIDSQADDTVLVGIDCHM